MDLAQWLASSPIVPAHMTDVRATVLICVCVCVCVKRQAMDQMRLTVLDVRGFCFAFFRCFAGSVAECAVNERRMKRPLCSPLQPAVLNLCARRGKGLEASAADSSSHDPSLANRSWLLSIFNARLSFDPPFPPPPHFFCISHMKDAH